MNEIDFVNLAESVKQAGQIRKGKLGLDHTFGHHINEDHRR